MVKRFGFTLLLAAVILTPQAGLAQPVGASGRGGGRGNANAGPQVIPLWPNGVPGALGDSDADKPEITFYRGGRSGTAVIIAPGGAYRNLSMESEGRQEAYWFNAMGVSAFVLKYRLTPYHYPVELNDAQRAIRIVRSRAQEFGIQPDRIGMMGFSAGGHLTATAGTHFDAGKPDDADPVERVSSRPDFLILCYPVISFQKSVAGANVLGAYASSGRNLLGDNPDQKTLDNLSDELQVTAQTPPTFLYHTTNDQLVAVENSVQFYLALRKAGVPAEMHLFENGGHGSGMGLTDPALSMWPTLLMNWMRARGLLTRH
ncbi:MAG TPA: alpha/beta hydrolase [Bryobacteraceae bacterium]|nr:alpha/beta hydrolase [Bryobacteraceae bacterium]